MTFFVQKFQSADLNAPTNSGQAGALIAVLNACLVDGYNYSLSVTSITRSGTTATVTIAAADMFKLQTGGTYTIAGATGADASLYNGTFTMTVATTTTLTYTMTGTPTGSATGTITLATALPITGITRSGQVALVNTTQANSTLINGDYLTVSGATQTEYNVTAAIKVPLGWTVSTAYVLGDLVTNDSGKIYVCRTAGNSASSGGPTGTSTGITDGSATWDYVAASGNSTKYFTYIVSGSPITATGTPVYYKAGLQWTKAFAAGTNQQSYQANASATGNRFFLQVNDDAATGGGAKEAAVYGAEVLTANNTANNGGGANTGRFPTAGSFASGLQWPKSDTASSAARTWVVRGDEKHVLLLPEPELPAADGANRSLCMLRALHQLSSRGTAFNTLIGGGSMLSTPPTRATRRSRSTASYGLTSTGVYLARTYLQTSTSGPGWAWPAPALALTARRSPPVDLGLWIGRRSSSPRARGRSGVRGRLPGVYCPVGQFSGGLFTDGDTWTNHHQPDRRHHRGVPPRRLRQRPDVHVRPLRSMDLVSHDRQHGHLCTAAAALAGGGSLGRGHPPRRAAGQPQRRLRGQHAAL
jgi:hypothetical protein